MGDLLVAPVPSGRAVLEASVAHPLWSCVGDGERR